MGDDQLLEITGELYDAALEAERWPQVLKKLQHLLSGGAYAHFLWDKKTGTVPLMYFSGFSPKVIESYQDYYSTIEPGADFIRKNPTLPLLHDYLWIEERAMDKDEYHTWLERESGLRYRLGGFAANSDRYFGITAVQYSRRQGPANEHGQRLFLQLLPHIRRATFISQEFSTLRDERMSFIEMLQQARHGILLLNAEGRVIFANRSAETLLAQTDGLILDRYGNPRANRPGERSDLERLIAAAVATNTSVEGSLGGVLPIGRPSGRRPYVLTIAPFRLPKFEAFLKPRPAAAIFITDPESVQVAPETLFRRAYRLTPGETRLALALLSADSLKDAAGQVGLTEGSARQTLKRIFSKTDCHSQAALMKLLLSLQGH
jgi:PAS domain-containing protein